MATMNMDTMDLHKTCRACLKTGNSKRQFSLNEEPLKSMFYYCTFLQIKPNEKYPVNLCSLCVALCDAAYNFREMCENSDRKIRSGQMIVVTEPPPSTDVAVASTQVPTTEAQQFKVEEIVTFEENLTVESIEEEYEDQDMDPIEAVEEIDEPITEIIISDEGNAFESKEQEEDNAENEYPNEELTATDDCEITELISCRFCGETYSSRVSMIDHYAEVHQDETYNCENCSKIFYTLNDWRSHLCRRPVRAAKESFVCEFCSEIFKFRRNLAKHLLEAHPGEAYRCYKCEKTFKNPDTWRTHNCKANSWEYLCNYCNAMFQFQVQLSRHVKRHLGTWKTKPKTLYKNQQVPCDICNVTFHSVVYLKKHQLVHTGETPFSCKECGRMFRSKCNLYRHLRTVHRDTTTKFSEL